MISRRLVSAPIRWITVSLLAAWLLPAASQAQAIAVSLQPSRTTGVAPLAVFFDASQTLHTNASFRPWQDLGYAWDFGDTGSGTWANTGDSKNSANGPMAGHVFEKPGTYTVKVVVTDPNGATASRSVSIQVSDPDSVYSGTNTACISSSGNFTGCPSGAVHMTTGDFDTALGTHVKNGHRVLFRRGDTFTTDAENRFNVVGPVTIGAYGSGAKPVINRTLTASNATLLLSAPNTPVLRDWRIMDLELRSGLYGGESAIQGRSYIENLLVLRVDMVDYPNGLAFFGSILIFDGLPPHKNLFFVENSVHRSARPPTTGSYPITMMAQQSAMLGNVSTNVNSPTHVFRSDLLQHVVVSYNDLRDPEPSRIVFKLHAPSWGKGYGYSEYVLVSRNRFHGGNNNWIMTLAPQNISSDERIRRVIVQGNYFTAGSSTASRIGVVVSADESVIRNNVFNMTGDGKMAKCIFFTHQGAEPNHFGNEADYNTCYDADQASGSLVAAANGDGSVVAARGNLVVATYSGATPNPGPTSDGNLGMKTVPFAASSFTRFADFTPAKGSAPVDAGGSSMPYPFDGLGDGRRLDGNNDGTAVADVGAIEIGSASSGGGGLQPPAAPILLP